MPTKFLNISIDSTLGGNSPSDEIVSSQKAIKDYVDSQTGSTVDQNYDPVSANAQSGIAVAEAISTKQDTLMAGSGISITSNTVSISDIDCGTLS